MAGPMMREMELGLMEYGRTLLFDNIASDDPYPRPCPIIEEKISISL